jgi:hypothetical protein
MALKRLWSDIGKMNFLDPASGSGNFLLVAYKKLRELELKLIARLRELQGTDTQIQIDGSIGLQIHLGQFHAIEYDEWSSQIAFVAMFLAEHQANKQMEEILGTSPNLFPLTDSAVVKQGNALRISWDSVRPMDGNTVIMGNPPFNGARLMSDEQKKDTRALWVGTKGAGNIDYVANWFLIASRWASTRGVRVGFVATSSISQGEQPAVIWGAVYPLGIGIDFAYRSFKWDNGAAVHCVIVGFSGGQGPKKKKLWFFPDIKGEPELRYAKNINAYLLDLPDILVRSRTNPIVPGFPPLNFGSQPNDDGFLSNISSDEANEIRKTDPVASKYLRRLVGARELLHSEERWCLWLQDAEPSDLRSSRVLKQRIEKVREYRMSRDRKATKELAKTPYLFGFISQPKASYIAVPLVSKETRDYVPMAILGADVVANNLISTIPDGSERTFGFLMSRVFNVWNKNEKIPWNTRDKRGF